MAVLDEVVVEPWWLPRLFGGEDGILKMQRGTYGLDSQQNRGRIWNFCFG